MCMYPKYTIILSNSWTISSISLVILFPHLTFTCIPHVLDYVGTVKKKTFVQIIEGGFSFHWQPLPPHLNLLNLLTSKKTVSGILCSPFKKHCIALVICLKGHCDVKLGPKDSNYKHFFFNKLKTHGDISMLIISSGYRGFWYVFITNKHLPLSQCIPDNAALCSHIGVRERKWWEIHYLNLKWINSFYLSKLGEWGIQRGS